MAELLTPGVIIQEVEFGPQPIEGVSTSTAGFVGETEWGPSSGSPSLVTSFADFQRRFGGFVAGAHLPHAVRGFFDNGGRRAFIARVVGSGASNGLLTLDSSDYNVRLTSATVPTGGNTSVTLTSVVGITLGGSSLSFVPLGGGSAVTVTVLKVDSATGTVLFSGVHSFSPTTHYAQIAADDDTGVVTVLARDPGGFSGRMGVLIDATYGDNVRIESSPATDSVVVSSVTPFQVGMRVQVERLFSDGSPAREVAEVGAIDSVARKLTFTANLTGTYPPGSKVFVISWRSTVTLDGTVVETLSSLRTTSPADLVADVAATSQWIRIDDSTPPTIDPAAGVFPAFLQGVGQTLSAGSAGAIDESSYVGVELPSRTGLKAIEAQQGISIIAAPGRTEPLVVGELVAQAERRMDRFAVFESPLANPDAPPDVTTVLTERGQYNSRYAAMYHPWLITRDPLTGKDIAVPPSGHVLGAYARTDNDRGVFKAPANVVLRGITNFVQSIPDGEQDLFNPAGVNILRRFDGLGNVIWGARTISAEPIWRYIPVRRLFIFIEQSLVRGTRFAVFEPNDTRLWARLRDAVTNFLTTQWRAGALFGAKPEEAFFVRVDETNNTEDDRANGRLNILIGIAPVRPAEFIVFQIGQAPNSVIIAEQG